MMYHLCYPSQIRSQIFSRLASISGVQVRRPQGAIPGGSGADSSGRIRWQRRDRQPAEAVGRHSGGTPRGTPLAGLRRLHRRNRAGRSDQHARHVITLPAQPGELL